MHKVLTSSEVGTSIFSWQEGCGGSLGDLALSPCCIPHNAQGKLPGRKNCRAGKPRDYWTGVNPASATSHGAYVVPGSREGEGQALRAIPILAVQESRRGFFRSR